MRQIKKLPRNYAEAYLTHLIGEHIISLLVALKTETVDLFLGGVAVRTESTRTKIKDSVLVVNFTDLRSFTKRAKGALEGTKNASLTRLDSFLKKFSPELLSDLDVCELNRKLVCLLDVYNMTRSELDEKVEILGGRKDFSRLLLTRKNVQYVEAAATLELFGLSLEQLYFGGLDDIFEHCKTLEVKSRLCPVIQVLGEKPAKPNIELPYINYDGVSGLTEGWSSCGDVFILPGCENRLNNKKVIRNIWSQLEYVRSQRGEEVTEFVKRLGVVEFWYQWLKYGKGPVDRFLLEGFARALGVDVGFLFKRSLTAQK